MADISNTTPVMNEEPCEAVDTQPPRHVVVRIIEWCYEKLVVPFSVLVFLLHVFDLPFSGGMYPQWKVYLIAPMTLAVSLSLMSQACLKIYDFKIFVYIWTFLKFLSNGTLRIGGTFISWVNANKFSKIVWAISFLNLGLIGFWIFVNMDIFKAFFNDMVLIFLDLFYYFSTPEKIFASLQQFLQRIHVLEAMKWFKVSYLDPTIANIYEGGYSSLFKICSMSVILLVIGLIPHLALTGFAAISKQGEPPEEEAEEEK